MRTLTIQVLLRLGLFLNILFAPSCTFAYSEILPPNDIDIFGQIQTVSASREETLLDIARRYDIGQEAILLANPDVDRWLPEDGAEVTLPLRFIIPRAERTGMIINLPEMRLYYFHQPGQGQKPRIITHPIGIGRMDWSTPLGKTTVTRKKKDPTWTPPQSLKNEALQSGGPPLPDVVLPGPDNPLGRYAIYLGFPGYLIHSTNKPFGVGMRVSHGCIRMYPEDIENFFTTIPAGASVQIVNQPIKLGWLNNLLFIELHPPLEEDQADFSDYTQKVHEVVIEFLEKNTQYSADMAIRIDQQALDAAIQARNGMPTLISEN